MTDINKTKVLFICTHNSARSQMAEGIMNTLYSGEFEAYSAGTEPSAVNPYAIQVMSEINIDISAHRSKSLDEFMGQTFDYVVTVCDNARESCPFFPGGKILHQSFRDPAAAQGDKEEILAVFRAVRDEIALWLKSFVNAPSY